MTTQKVAFVTGAGSGIGQATAKLFAARGFAVIAVDLNKTGGLATEQAIRDAGGECQFTECDVANDASVKSAVEFAVQTYGRLDACFNAAGIDGESGKPTADCSIENWNRLIAVNLTGVFHCMRHQIPAILKSGGGAIVNCASTAGLRGVGCHAAYSASKHGVVGLTKSAALEYAGIGVRINAVCPGMINTPMTQRDGMHDVIEKLAQASPAQRIGQPEEIAAAALWLCSEDASFVHGQAIAVDGAITSR